MIDPSLRNQLIAELASAQVGVLLLDVVIGYGATADPAASLVEACQRACAGREEVRCIAIATVTGTESDPQCRSRRLPRLKMRGSWWSIACRKPRCLPLRFSPGHRKPTARCCCWTAWR
jgi:FdrA protein